ncbi:ABC transporter substrate-binding protein [Vibrio paucivorans]|uniref:ABC transporter substrate-binding protein n=1 Tax=Vibrio paucivorans TaxID=2829489 RepID=A0A9X3CG88_9VIBR|nr:ABC transporter substrate-binding protein [Vibrio paucivorans]MCW8335238.1 ABC transporter substrate-binding protein [Vibrio paucivorans]
MKFITLLFAALIAFNASAIEIEHEMGTAHFDATPSKVVTLDWALTETVLSLGIEPYGVADVPGYDTWVSQPKLSPGTIDVGSRREPNLELLTDIKPDVILISQHMAPAIEQLQKIAPVLVFTVYSDKKAPLESAEHITTQLGALFGKQQQAKNVIEATHKRLADNGDAIRKQMDEDKPLMFIRFINDKTLRIHSDGSLAQSTIALMGLENSWHEQTNQWGFTTAGIEKLAEHQKTNLMIFGPLNDTERQQLISSPLWQAMEFTRTDSVYELPAIWTFGGLLSAQRFSDHITRQLLN